MNPRQKADPDQPVLVLLIDDDPDFSFAMGRHLSRLPDLRVEFFQAQHPVEGLGRLHQHDIDLVFLDYNLGSEDGIGVLQEIRRSGDDRAIIILTGVGDEYLAARSIREGADDYLVKADVGPEMLQRAITNARAQVERRRAERDLAETAKRLADANRALVLLAREDELTGLATRRYFNERLTQEVSRARRFSQPVSLLFIDVDHFKQVNDSHGHAVGDQVLSTFGRLIREALRDSDLAGRYGGDELCVYLAQTPLDGARVFAERLLASFQAELFELEDGETLRVSTSIGVAELCDREDTLEKLVERADDALYAAKDAGRGCVSASAESESEPQT